MVDWSAVVRCGESAGGEGGGEGGGARSWMSAPSYLDLWPPPPTLSEAFVYKQRLCL